MSSEKQFIDEIAVLHQRIDPDKKVTFEFNQSLHANTRTRLLEGLEPNSLVLLIGNVEVIRNGSVITQDPRQDSNFMHLTGLDEMNAAALLTNIASLPPYTLLVEPIDPNEIKWHYQTGLDNAIKRYGADHAHPIDDLEQLLLEYGKKAEKIYLIAPRSAMPCPYSQANTYHEIRLKIDALSTLIQQQIITNPNEKTFNPDARNKIHRIRQVKGFHELALLKEAGRIIAEAHRHAMLETGRLLRSHRDHPQNPFEIPEVTLQHFIESYAGKNGIDRLAFPTIVASDPTILHYFVNNAVAKYGDLILIDAGVEKGGYNSDCTRTFPVSGRFNEKQKLIYQAVLDANEAGIVIAKPGRTLRDIYKKICHVLTDRLVTLNILKTDKPANAMNDQEKALCIHRYVEDKAYLPYFMHSPCHWLGRDVHDFEEDPMEHPDGQPDFFRSNWNRPLQAGDVITIEPGLYFSPDLVERESLSKSWAGIGVRIEDDIVITPEGEALVLTEAAPRSIADIERLMLEGE